MSSKNVLRTLIVRPVFENDVRFRDYPASRDPVEGHRRVVGLARNDEHLEGPAFSGKVFQLFDQRPAYTAAVVAGQNVEAMYVRHGFAALEAAELVRDQESGQRAVHIACQ